MLLPNPLKVWSRNKCSPDQDGSSILEALIARERSEAVSFDVCDEVDMSPALDVVLGELSIVAHVCTCRRRFVRGEIGSDVDAVPV